MSWRALRCSGASLGEQVIIPRVIHASGDVTAADRRSRESTQPR